MKNSTEHDWSGTLLLGLLLALFLWLIFIARAFGQGVSADHAVVRIPSHGASATVIWTSQGKSYLLGCAHAYQGRDAQRRMVIDVPSDRRGEASGGGIRLIAVDYRLDLSLVEMGVGPLPHLPVAPQGHRISQRLVSLGYDNMRWPATRAWADVIGGDAIRTYTRQAPWHGRSGGALADPVGPYLVGVVQGYEVEGGRPGKGIYASHRAILSFLQGRGWSLGGQRFEQREQPFDLLLPRQRQPECLPGGT